MLTIMPESVLVKKQVKTFEKKGLGVEDGDVNNIKVNVRYDDQCGNGHNTFSITADVSYKGGGHSCGCQHELVVEHFPELEKYIKWHLTSCDGPLHYIANSMYWAKEGNLEYARNSAVWPDAELEDFTPEKLNSRLLSLMLEFKQDMESLGFVY